MRARLTVRPLAWLHEERAQLGLRLMVFDLEPPGRFRLEREIGLHTRQNVPLLLLTTLARQPQMERRYFTILHPP
jgi:hypothetical protein